MRRWILLPAGVAVVLYGGMVLLFGALEKSFIFFPNHPSREIIPPDRAELPYRWVELHASDGVVLKGWEIDALEPSGKWLIFFHGNAGTIADRADQYRHLRTAGLNVLAVDYRGYGRSEGSPDESGLYRDADACYDHLIAKGISPERILLYGESLGSAVAIDLAARRKVGGLIVEGAFQSVTELGQELYPFLPVRWLVSNKFDSYSKIEGIHVPALFIHAVDDEVIPVHHGRALFERAPGPKTFLEVRGGHNGSCVVDAQKFYRGIGEFLGRL